MKEGYKRHGFWRVTGGIIGGVLIAAVFALAFGALVMVLWNWLMPVIFGLGEIGYWQGFGLVLLAKLLFGGIGHKGPEPGKNRGPGAYWHGRRDHGKESDRCHGRFGHFDDVYEDWWAKEGLASFDQFMKKKQEDRNGEKAGNQNE